MDTPNQALLIREVSMIAVRSAYWNAFRQISYAFIETFHALDYVNLKIKLCLTPTIMHKYR